MCVKWSYRLWPVTLQWCQSGEGAECLLAMRLNGPGTLNIKQSTAVIWSTWRWLSLSVNQPQLQRFSALSIWLENSEPWNKNVFIRMSQKTKPEHSHETVSQRKNTKIPGNPQGEQLTELSIIEKIMTHIFLFFYLFPLIYISVYCCTISFFRDQRRPLILTIFFPFLINLMTDFCLAKGDLTLINVVFTGWHFHWTIMLL